MNRRGHGMGCSIVTIIAAALGLGLMGPFVWLCSPDLIPNETAQNVFGAIAIIAWLGLLAWGHWKAWKRWGAVGIMPGMLYLVLTGVFFWLARNGY